MPRQTPTILLAIALSAVAASAQVTATYGTYGTGCNGTGVGLNAMHVLPATATNAFGSGNAIPQGWTPNRFQQVFPGTDLPVACTLAAMRFRCPNQPALAVAFGIDMEVKVGFTTKPVGGLSTTFASNWDSGTPVTVVPRTQVNFPDAVRPASPAEFLITVPWTNTLAWAPTPGLNLLVEFVVYGNSAGSGIYGYALDNVSGTQAVWGTPATATTGQSRSFGPVIGFVEQTNTAVPVLYSNDPPQINNQFRVRLAQAHPSTVALMLLGLSNSSHRGLPLPLPLAGVGAPGCSLLASADLLSLVNINGTGTGSLQYNLPNNFYLLNLHIYNQAAILDAGANSLGLAFTNGGVGLVGNQ